MQFFSRISLLVVIVGVGLLAQPAIAQTLCILDEQGQPARNARVEIVELGVSFDMGDTHCTSYDIITDVQYEVPSSEVPSIQAFPTVGRGNFRIVVNHSGSGSGARLGIYDNLGRRFAEKELDLRPGENLVDVTIGGASGQYHIALQSRSSIETVSVFVLNARGTTSIQSLGGGSIGSLPEGLANKRGNEETLRITRFGSAQQTVKMTGDNQTVTLSAGFKLTLDGRLSTDHHLQLFGSFPGNFVVEELRSGLRSSFPLSANTILLDLPSDSVRIHFEHSDIFPGVMSIRDKQSDGTPGYLHTASLHSETAGALHLNSETYESKSATSYFFATPRSFSVQQYATFGLPFNRDPSRPHLAIDFNSSDFVKTSDPYVRVWKYNLAKLASSDHQNAKELTGKLASLFERSLFDIRFEEVNGDIQPDHFLFSTINVPVPYYVAKQDYYQKGTLSELSISGPSPLQLNKTADVFVQLQVAGLVNNTPSSQNSDGRFLETYLEMIAFNHSIGPVPYGRSYMVGGSTSGIKGLFHTLD